MWHLTNLVLAADANCQALLPDMTGMNYIVAADYCSAVTVTQSVAPGTALGLGTNEVVLGAADAAGNVAYCTNHVAVADQTPPTLSCPANIIVQADAGTCSKSNVTWEVAASDNCGVANVVSEPPSGSTFPTGRHDGDVHSDGRQRQYQRVLVHRDCGFPAYILAQPVSQTVARGQDAAFSVTATNDCGSTLLYQWRWNGGEIAGATGSAYTRTNIQCADAGSFDVVVS